MATTSQPVKGKRKPGSTATAARAARLETRVNAETKSLIQRAADISGRSLSDFIVNSARQEAERTIRAHDVISLSVRDSRLLAELLRNPPPPSEELKAALRQYRADVAPNTSLE
jgi:uncharacterized protein (DUF1778 family)